jgi:secreted trypsin-like serine protease
MIFNRRISSQNSPKFQTVKVHPLYNSRSRHHDIALLKLKSPVPTTNEIKPVCLSSDDSEIPKNFSITGFGSTESGKSTTTALSGRLLRATVKDFPHGECKSRYKENGREVIDNQYCANSETGEDACQGDSGGPLSYEGKEGALYQYGVISYGAGCGSQFPAIYTKVNKYLEWIGDEMLKFEIAV